MNKPQRNPALAWREVENEIFITSADGECVYTLSEIGAAIWRACDGTATLDEIIEGLMAEYDVDRETLAADVEEYLGKLRESDLLT